MGGVTNLGILGGSFDPPHYGHLTLAETARVQLGLAQVLFVPAGAPPHKSEGPAAAPHHRARMVEVATADNGSFHLSRVDLDRPGPHYTVETLPLLHQQYPRAEFYFLMGGDSLAQFLDWRNPGGIVRQARLGVMKRPGWEADLERLEEAIPDIRERLTWLDAPRLEISGTDLRRRVREGLPIRYLVPPTVEEYVHRHRLYQPPSE